MQTLFNIPERLTMEIGHMAIYDYRYLIPEGNMSKQESHMSVSVRLGDDLNVRNVHFTDNHKEEKWFSQNWAMASIRAQDGPLFHHNDPDPLILEDLIAKAFYDQLIDPDNRKAYKNALAGIAFSITNPIFKPPNWHNQSIIVPIDYIRLYSLRRDINNGFSTCSIQLGEHLTLHGEEILGTIFRQPQTSLRLRPESIYNTEIISIINQMLNNPTVLDLFDNKHSPLFQYEFEVSVPGYIHKEGFTPFEPCYFK